MSIERERIYKWGEKFNHGDAPSVELVDQIYTEIRKDRIDTERLEEQRTRNRAFALLTGSCAFALYIIIASCATLSDIPKDGLQTMPSVWIGLMPWSHPYVLAIVGSLWSVLLSIRHASRVFDW